MGNACTLNVSDEKEEGIKDNSFFFFLNYHLCDTTFSSLDM